MNATHTLQRAVVTPAIKTGFWAGWTRFWFLPRSVASLHLLRIIFAAILLAWLLPLAGHVDSFFGLEGWMDEQALAEIGGLANSPVDLSGWSLLYLVGREAAALQAFYWGTIAVFALFFLGIATRFTSVLTWLCVCSFTANPLLEGEADVFLRLISFYLMIGYVFFGWNRLNQNVVGRVLSLTNNAVWRMKGSIREYSAAATLAIRLLQVHFALAVVMLALHKLQMAEWWGGVSFWYVLNRPSEVTRESLRRWGMQRDYYLFVLSLGSYAVLAWQLAFPVFAWKTGKCRWLLLGGGLAGCLGLMVLYQIPTMGPVFLACCLAYLKDEEWDRLTAPIRRWLSWPVAG